MMHWIEIIIGFITTNSLVGYLVFYRQKRKQESLKTKKDEVQFQSEHINRLDVRIEKLESKVDKLTDILDRNEEIIRAAYRCPMSREDVCPVLQKRTEFERNDTNLK